MKSDLDRLAIDAATLFVLSDADRIERQNRREPDAREGPLLWFAGCAEGNVVRYRADLPEGLVQKCSEIVAREPPWTDISAQPSCFPSLTACFRDMSSRVTEISPIYVLPNDTAYNSGATIVGGHQEVGQQLLTRLEREGMPPSLVKAGFVSIDDFWEPWVVALDGETIAATAFAARIGAIGAEAGVYTFEGFRGRGLAAAVTARWSALESLEGRDLFYSTSRTNLSSQRVTVRLGLRRIGQSISLF